MTLSTLSLLAASSLFCLVRLFCGVTNSASSLSSFAVCSSPSPTSLNPSFSGEVSGVSSIHCLPGRGLFLPIFFPSHLLFFVDIVDVSFAAAAAANKNKNTSYHQKTNNTKPQRQNRRVYVKQTQNDENGDYTGRLQHGMKKSESRILGREGKRICSQPFG